MEHNNKIYRVIFNIIMVLISVFLMIPIIIIIGKAFFISENGKFLLSFNELKHIILLSGNFNSAFVNSLIYTSAITIFQTIFGILIAFLFSKFKFKFREALFVICLIVILLPFQVTMVQNYNLYKSLNLSDKMIGVIIPQIFLPVGIIFLRKYFVRINESIIETAAIDGASTLQILLLIIIPIGKNGILLLFFLAFVDSYNMYELPLTVLSDAGKYPLSLLMRDVIQDNVEHSFVPAVLYMIPSLGVFMFLKKYIVKGMDIM